MYTSQFQEELLQEAEARHKENMEAQAKISSLETERDQLLRRLGEIEEEKKKLAEIVEEKEKQMEAKQAELDAASTIIDTEPDVTGSC